MNILRKMRWGFLFLIILILGSPLKADSNHALLIEINGIIGPATVDYLEKAIESSQNTKADFIIMKLNPAGSLDTSLQNFLKIIIESPVPIVSYISSAPTKSNSASTFILYASHIAAMSPISYLSNPLPIHLHSFLSKIRFLEKSENPLSKNEFVSKEQATQQQMIRDVMNYFKNTAELRGRNGEWPQKSLMNGNGLSAGEALKLNVINIVAKDIPDLIEKLQGNLVSIHPKTFVMNTKNLQIKYFDQDFHSNFLGIMTQPTMAYLLLMIGFYGLLFECLSPGYILPGITGAISLFLALYALSILPINDVGFLLLIFGIILMTAEVFIYSFGILAVGGVIAFILGSIMLIDTHDPIFKINSIAIFTVVLINIAFLYGLLRMLIRSRLQKVHTGTEAMIGQIGIANFDFLEEGEVTVVSEKWHAKTIIPLSKGQSIKVIKVEGLTVWVEPILYRSPLNL